MLQEGMYYQDRIGPEILRKRRRVEVPEVYGGEKWSGSWTKGSETPGTLVL